MITIRKSDERGVADHGWLTSRHTFSFADYHDPNHTGFRALRVINEDRVEPGKGFDEHPHRDMEIMSYVMTGALEHRDSLGNGAVVRPGDVQVMSAGSGVTHSEFNHSDEDPVHFLQIWIMPSETGLRPDYDQKHFAAAERRDVWRLVASSDGREESLVMHQDVNVYAALLTPGVATALPLSATRYGWLQVVAGEIAVNAVAAGAGDGLAISREGNVTAVAAEPTEALLFDLG